MQTVDISPVMPNNFCATKKVESFNGSFDGNWSHADWAESKGYLALAIAQAHTHTSTQSHLKFQIFSLFRSFIGNK